MRLADLKQVAVRRQARIRFPLPGGLECVVSEHGLAQVPGLARAPEFNLEDAARSAAAFTLEPVRGEAPRRVSAEQLAAMAGGAGEPHPDEHDD
jgi:hypothetical protein